MSTGFDKDEIAKFDANAKAWWDFNGPLKTLHDINPVRTQYIHEKINLQGKTVLDVGCGAGILSEAMARLGAQVTGLDLSPTCIEVAKQHAAKSQLNIEYQCVGVDDFATEHAQQFDVVTCLELLEHVSDPEHILQACAKCIKADGHVFLSTLNRNLKSFMLAIVGAEYVLNIIPKGTHHFDKLITPAELHQTARRAELSIIEFKGLSYQPFSRQTRLTDDISVNYLAYARPKSITPF